VARCIGVLRIFERISSARARRAGSPEGYGSRSISIAAGRTVRVNVQLDAGARRLLARRRSLPSFATAVVRQPNGTVRRVTRAITLRRPGAPFTGRR
jgi:hypothetical protein